MAEPSSATYPTSAPTLFGEVSNAYSRTVSGAHTSGATTISCGEAITPLTAPGYLLNGTTSEIIYFGGVSGNDLTSVTRGADGTVATAMANGQLLYLVNTANMHNQANREITAIASTVGLSPLTIDDTESPADPPSSIANWMDMISEIVKTITGAATWDVADVPAVMEADYDANTILAATADNTPAALTVAEQTLLGRITAGNIDALTATEVRTLLNVEDGAEANNISDVNATDLTDGGDTTLHDHDGISENTSARHTQGTDTALGAVGTKNPPIDADKFLYRDSTSADALVTSTGSEFKAYLKTYFDTVLASVALDNLASVAINTDLVSDTDVTDSLGSAAKKWLEVFTARQTFVEAGSTATPAAGDVALYAKADGLLYSKDDAGVETQVSGGAGGGNTSYIDQSGGTSDTYGVLAGTINGTNTTFTVSQVYYVTGSLRVYLNGQLQTQGTGEDWVETDPSSGTFDFLSAPQVGDEILVVYGSDAVLSDALIEAGYNNQVTVVSQAAAEAGTSTTVTRWTPERVGQAINYISPRPNVLINGNMDIAQRGTSFAAIANNTYSVDRWRTVFIGTMVYTISQSTDVPTEAESGIKSSYSLKLDCTTADGAMAAGDRFIEKYIVEGYDYKNLKEQDVTLSFWVKATKTGVYCVSFINNGYDRSYVVEYTINTAATWEKKTITLTLDQTGGTENYTNASGLQIGFALATGTNYETATPNTWISSEAYATSNQVNACDSTDNDFYLAQVKLELGSGATPFVARLYEEELALCERYYEKSFDLTTAPTFGVVVGGAVHFGMGINASTSITIPFKVKKRTAPTILTWHNSAGGVNASYYSIAGVGDYTNGTAGYIGSNAFTFTCGTANVASKTFVWTADAEL